MPANDWNKVSILSHRHFAASFDNLSSVFKKVFKIIDLIQNRLRDHNFTHFLQAIVLFDCATRL